MNNEQLTNKSHKKRARPHQSGKLALSITKRYEQTQ